MGSTPTPGISDSAGTHKMLEETSLVEVASVPDPVQANLLKLHLEQMEIPAVLFNDFTRRGIVGEISCPMRIMVRQ